MSRTSGLMRSISSTRTPGRRSLTHERLHRHRLTGCHVAPILLQHDQTISGDHRRQDAGALRPRRPHFPAAVGELEDAALEFPPSRLLPHRLDRARLPGLREEAPAPGQLEERGVLKFADGGWEVRTTGPQGSGILSSMVTGNCLIVLEEDRGDVAAGEAVTVEPFV